LRGGGGGRGEAAERADVVGGDSGGRTLGAGLVHGDLGRRGDARDRAEVGPGDRRLHSEVARGGARRVRAVACTVARREVVVLEVEAGCLGARREVLRTHELGRVVVLVPLLTGDDRALEGVAVGLVAVDVGAV